MTIMDIDNTHHRRAAGRLAVSALALLALASCGSLDRTHTASIDDYRERHPIVVSEAEHVIDLPVASGDRTLTTGMKDVIRGFAAERSAKSSGVVRVLYPEGAVNSGAAGALRKQIAAELMRAGVARRDILEGSYAAGGTEAPVRLSYLAVSATVASECGEWPKDIMPGMNNGQYHNFGCATQNNLATQVANPMDLVGPRAMTPIDAEQRSNVISTYRGG